jgi:hypothetical protein
LDGTIGTIAHRRGLSKAAGDVVDDPGDAIAARQVDRPTRLRAVRQ